jgi:hypothetical protein
MRRPLTTVRSLFTEISRPLTTMRRLFMEISRLLTEVFVGDFSSVGSGVASSVGYPVFKYLILSGQCRQCYLLLENTNYWHIVTIVVATRSPKVTFC